MFRCHFTAFIFLLAMAPLGCHTINKLGCHTFNKAENMLVRKLDAVILTADDLPMMEVDAGLNFPIPGLAKQPPVVDGFVHVWNETQSEEGVYCKYWLFQSVADAQKAADQWRGFLASATIEINGQRESAYQPEPNAVDVIGDATWRPANDTSIWFVKNNVLVYVMGSTLSINQLPLTRSVARKIETKINTALNQQ